MIPRVAHFYWTGGPLPWLREQGLVSFVRHHPGWDVVLASPEDRPVPEGVRLVRDDVTDPRLPPAARSDAWRWHVLAMSGGLYADTDVLFLRSVEPIFSADTEAWLTQDTGTPLVKKHRGPRFSIGVVASQPGAAFFRRLDELARCEPASEDYQSHGTSLIVRHWASLPRERLANLPGRAFYRGAVPESIAALWQPCGDVVFGPHEFGLHWYGGSRRSERAAVARSDDELPDCLVRRALAGAVGPDGYYGRSPSKACTKEEKP